MTKLRLACLLVLALLTALPAFGAKVPISGRVVGPGGTPVAEAAVRLVPVLDALAAGRLELEGKASPEPVVTGTTDKAGAFQLTAEPGFWKVVVEAEGLAPVEHELTPLVDAVELPAAELKRSFPVQVQVTGPDGQGVANARVTVEIATENALRLRSPWRPVRGLATTNGSGIAQVFRPVDERLTLRAGAVDFPLVERKNTQGIKIPLTLPAGKGRPLRVQDAAGRGIAGVLVRIRQDETLWPVGFTNADGLFNVPAPLTGKIEVHLRSADGRWATAHLPPAIPEKKEPQAVLLQPAATATARVLSKADGKPVPGAFVWLTTDPGTSARTGADGVYRLAVPAGSASYLGGAASSFFAETGAPVRGEGRERRGPTLSLTPRAAVTGLVVDEKGQGIAGAEIVATYSPAGLRPGASTSVFLSGGLARTSPAGRFRIDNLFPGTSYSLRITKQGFAPGRTDVPPREAGRAAAELRIVLRSGRTAFGRVQDSHRAPVAGASVTLRPTPAADPMVRLLESREGGAPFEATTDGTGRFELANLPAGTYDLTARGRGFAPLTVPGLEIPEGSGATDLGTLGLVPGVPVAGLVTDPQGKPIEGAEVRASPASGDPTALFRKRFDPGPVAATTAADGTFVLEDRAAGETLDLSASHPSYASGSAPGVAVTAEPGGPPVRLTLQPRGQVAGRVVGPDGRPVPGAQVSIREMVSQTLGGRSMRTAMQFASTQADDEGAFRFGSVAPGPIELSASAPRRQTGELSGIEVKAGEELAGLEIVLPPGALVTGRVLGPEGRPLPGVEVNVLEAGGNAVFGAFPQISAHTDGDGAYVLDGVPPGPRTIAALAEGYPQNARELEVKEGENVLDFSLDRGAEVSGRVVDDSGNPVAGVQLTLMEGSNFMSSVQAVSSPDGSFHFTGVMDGTFRLLARKSGFAHGGTDTVTVTGGASVGGLEVKLGGGSTITGRLSGIAFDDLARVQVWANSEFNRGRVDAEGVYRIGNLRPGEWRVTAEVPGSSRRAEGRVKIEEGALEARLDLRFGDGFELSGLVLRNGQPAAGTVVNLERAADRAPAWKEVDHQGSFQFGGLEAGTYEVSVQDGGGGTLYEENVEVSGDRRLRIELKTAALSGRVVDAAGAGPVAGATVSLASPGGRPRGLDPEVRTDSRGNFRFAEVGEGTWTLRAARDGYAPAEQEVQTDGMPVDGVELTLQPTEGLALEVLLASGRPPDRIRAAALAPDGRVVAQGTYPVGDGIARLSDVPPGSWQVVIDSDQAAPVTLTATAPGPAVRVALPPGGGLKVKIPDPETVTLTLTGPGGEPFRVVRWEGLKSSWDVTGGEQRFERVPAGSWTVTAQKADGRIWTGTVTVVAGVEVEVRLQ